MYREIKKRNSYWIIESRSAKKQRLIAEINRLDWIYSSMQLDRQSEKEAVGRIINGDFLTDISINEHSIISNYKGVIDLAYDMAEMDYYLNEKYMFKLYKILTGETEAEYRKSNPVLRMIAYNPPHFKEIEEQMELMFNWLHSNLYQTNPIEKAAYLHNKLLKSIPIKPHPRQWPESQPNTI